MKFEGDDEELVRTLKADHPGAYKELYKRYASDVHRRLIRVMGPPDAELEELLHEVFAQVDGKARAEVAELCGVSLATTNDATFATARLARHIAYWTAIM